MPRIIFTAFNILCRCLDRWLNCWLLVWCYSRVLSLGVSLWFSSRKNIKHSHVKVMICTWHTSLAWLKHSVACSLLSNSWTAGTLFLAALLDLLLNQVCRAWQHYSTMFTLSLLAATLVVLQLLFFVCLMFIVCRDSVLLGRLFNGVNLIKPVSNVRPSIRTYVCTFTKTFFDFNEIWHVGRGRWVMHDGMQYDPNQG